MTKRKERTLKDLFDLTERIAHPEITPVLKGSFRIQGPLDDAEQDLQSQIVLSLTSNRNPIATIIEDIHMKAKPGTCNVCAAPCSSCMHFNSAASPMESKIEEECSNETCGGKETTLFQRKACDEQQMTGSEASNLMSTTSSHDSFIENAESNATRQTHEQKERDCDCDSISYFNGIKDSITSCNGRNPFVASAALHLPLGSEPSTLPSAQDISSVGDSKELVEISGSVPQSEPCQFPPELGKASLVGSAITVTDEQKSVFPNVEENKPSITGNKSSVEELVKLHPSVKSETGNTEIKLPRATISFYVRKEAGDAGSLPAENLPLEGKMEPSGADALDDVKVCDICGDAGREDLLAVCGKCSDGAEHTYCMRVFLDKVPEGYWMCEGCKLEDAENGKSVKPENFEINVKNESPTSPKLPSSAAKNLYSEATFKGKLLPKSDTDGQLGENQLKGVMSSFASSKRQLDGVEISSKPKRQAIETIIGSPGKRTSFSRESSFTNLDSQTSKSARSQFANINLTQMGCQAVNASSPNTSGMLALPSSPRATFSRSNSLSRTNSKPKVKQVLDDIPQRQKVARESTFSDASKDSDRTLSKSTSFKATSMFQSGTDLRAKMQCSDVFHAESPRALKFAKERHPLDRRNSLKLECSGTTSRPLTKADSAGTGFNRGLETAIASDGRGESKRQISDGLCSFEEQKPSQGGHKTDTNAKDNTSFKSKHACSMVSSNIRCHKCNNTGHSAQVCTSSNVHAYGPKASTTRNSREDTEKSNKWRDVVVAAKSRTAAHKSTDRNGLSMSSIGVCSEVGLSKDLRNLSSIHAAHPSREVGQVSSSSGETKPWMMNTSIRASECVHLSKTSVFPEFQYIWQGCFEVRRSVGGSLVIFNGLQAHLSTCVSPKVPEIVCKLPLKVQVEEVPRLGSWPEQFQGTCATEDNIALYFFAQDVESYERSYKKLVESLVENDLALRAILDGVDLLIFASNQLPEQARRWNRLFYLWAVFRERRKNDTETLPPQKRALVNALEVELAVKDMDIDVKIDQNLTGESGSYGQIIECSSTCRNSAESLGTAKADKAVELANISSPHEDCPSCYTSLPHPNQHSVDPFCKPGQSIIGDLISLQTNTTSSFHGGHPSATNSQVVGGVGSGSENKGNTTTLKEVYRDPMCSSTVEFQHCDSMTNVQWDLDNGKSCPVDSYRMKTANVGFSSLPAKVDALSTSFMIPVLSHSKPASASNCGTDREKFTPQEKEIAVSNGKFSVSNIQRDSITEEERPERNFSRKRCYSDFSATASVVPHGTSRTSQTMPWEAGTDCMVMDGEEEHKKIKWCSELPVRDDSLSDLFSSKIHVPCSNFLNVLQNGHNSVAGHSFSETFRETEKSLFPMDSKLGCSSSSCEVSSAEEERSELDVPNLELALGAEAKSSNKEVLPLFLQVADDESIQKKVSDPFTDYGDEEASASLSLSLAFPCPEKKQIQKTVSKAELLPGSKHVNKSLLLFGGSIDT